jgi:hypothetical protein
MAHAAADETDTRLLDPFSEPAIRDVLLMAMAPVCTRALEIFHNVDVALRARLAVLRGPGPAPSAHLQPGAMADRQAAQRAIDDKALAAPECRPAGPVGSSRFSGGFPGT